MRAFAPPVKRRKQQAVEADPNYPHAWLRRRMRGKKPLTPRQIIITGILEALKEGPATTLEIERRMGVRPSAHRSVSDLCRMLERQRHIRLVGRVSGGKCLPADHPAAPIVWALVIKEPS